MQRAGAKWLWAVCALVGVWGCECGRTPVESVLEVSFERPAQGQRLEQSQDEDPQAEGFQYEVVAVAADSSERALSLASAKLEVRGQGESEWRAGPEAVVEGERVRFPGTLLLVGNNTLRVSVEEQGSLRTATSTATVSVATPAAPAVEIAEPAEGRVLREADDADPTTPGYQVRFRLQTTGLAGRTGTLSCTGVCGMDPTQFVVGSDGTGLVGLTLSEPVLYRQDARCVAVVERPEGSVSSPARNVSLDTQGPRLVFTSPLGPVASTPFRVEAVVLSAEEGSTATLAGGSDGVLTATVRGGVVSFPSVSADVEGSREFTLRVEDRGGNVTSERLSVLVASTPPTLELGVPATVVADANGDPGDGVQARVEVRVTGVQAGAEVELWTAVGSQFGQPQRALVQQEGVALVARFTLALAEGANAVKACVRNPAGLQGCQLVSTVVQTNRPQCRIATPAAGQVVGGSAPIAVRVESPNGPVSLVATPEQGPGAPPPPVTGTALGGTASLSLSLPADGTWRLLATCPGGGVSQALALRRDTTPPTLSASVRDAPNGQIGPSFLDTSSLPGTQVILDLQAEPLSEVRVQGCELPAMRVARVDTAGRAVVRNVTVPSSGSCELSLQAVDLMGNTATATLPISSSLASASLQFSVPDTRRTLGPSDGAVGGRGGLTLPVELTFASAQGELKLYRNDQPQPIRTSSVAATESSKRFEVELDEGITVLRAVLESSAGASTCASALYSVDTIPANLAPTAPATSTSYALGQDQDPTTPGIQRPLSYSLENASAAASVDVCTSVALTPAAAPCRDGSDGWYSLATDLPTFTPLFSYPDGRYSLKLVLDEGSNRNSTTPLTLAVDGSRPEVTALSFLGDSNSDGRLNATELPSGAPVLRVSTAGLEAGRPIQLRHASNNTLYGQASAQGDSTDVTLNSLPSAADSEADYPLVVVLTDAANNTNRTVAAAPLNPLDPVNALALTNLRLDRVAPSLLVNAPSQSTFGPAGDADATQPGFQLRVSVVTGADVGREGLMLRLEPPGLEVRETPTGGSVIRDFTLEDTGTRSYTLTMQATDASGNQSSLVTRSFTVDLEAPRLVLESPAAGTVTDVSQVLVRVRAEGGEGLQLRVLSRPSGGSTRVQVGTLTVSSGVAEGTLNFPEGLQDVIVETEDAAGNPASATAANVRVQVVGCDVAISSPAQRPVRFLQSDDENPAVQGLQYTLRGRTLRCPNRAVSLYKGPSTTPLASTVTDGTGLFAFSLSLDDGEQSRLTAEMEDSLGNRTRDFFDYTVDLIPPAIRSVTPAQTTLTFVAEANVNLLPTPAPGYVRDLTAGGNAEANYVVTVEGAEGGTVQVFYRDQAVSSAISVGTSPETLTVPFTLPQDTTGTLEVRVRDANGNQVVHSASATVDVIAPAQVVLTPTIANARRAWVDLAWTASGDDGLSGAPQGYDLRWTTEIQLATGIPDEATYYGPKVRQETGALLPASTTSYRLTVPPLSRYFIEVRARDEVGNVAAFRAIPAVSNLAAPVVLNNPGTGNRYGTVVASADFNGDGREDLVVPDGARSSSAGSNVGAVYIYYELRPASVGAPQILLPPSDVRQLYGVEVAVGNVGDAASEGRPDLLVGAPQWSNSRGRALLYFGRTGQQIDPSPIEFRGRTGVGATNFGWAARIINDINGDGVDEVLLSADLELSGRGRVYLFFGRSRAAWQTAATGDEGDGALFVPVDSADRIFEGETVLTPVPASTFFGRRRGQANVGDLNGDGVPEFTLSEPLDRINSVYIYSGATILNRNGSTPAERTLRMADVLRTLTRGAAGTGGSNGFGVEVLGAPGLLGGTAVDLLSSLPRLDNLFVFANGGASGTPPVSITVAPDSTVSGTRFFGHALAAADINRDGRPDFVVGENAGDGSSAWVLYNQGGTSPLDTVAGDGFAQSRFRGARSLGNALAVGDFNGDGAPDIAAGAPLDAPGRVTIWY